MPIFTPGSRWQPAYSPFKNEPLSHKLMEDFEYMLKGPLFGCQHVRQLSLAGDGVHLPDGMPEEIA